MHESKKDISAGGDVNYKGNIDEHSHIYIYGEKGGTIIIGTKIGYKQLYTKGRLTN